jgi:hypothetical protein
MQSNRADNILNPMGGSEFRPQIRENNNVLNPGGAPASNYRPDRATGYQNHQSAAGSLIYGQSNDII